MYYVVDAECAEDDGTAWDWNGPRAIQVRPLSVAAITPGRVLSVAGCILVDQNLADQLKASFPSVASRWQLAAVRGPQPESSPLAPMLQIRGLEEIPLASSCLLKDSSGRVLEFTEPFVLDEEYRRGRSTELPVVCTIKENGLLIVADPVAALLSEADKTLYFNPVRFSDEEARSPYPVRPAFRVPTAEALRVRR